MSAFPVLIILFFIHTLACLFWFYRHKSTKQDAILLIPMTFLLPGIGLLLTFIASRSVNDSIETPVSKLYQDVEKDSLKVSAGRPEPDAVVPFDEVLLLSNDKSRREVMMHILRRDPFLYLEMLKTAKVSSDVEVTHYATTTIMEIQRELDISMQKAEADYQANNEELETVNRYISALSSYIETGLLLENRQIQLRKQLSEVLEHKLSIFKNSRSAHLQLIKNEIHLRSFDRAAEVAAMMCQKWPADERAWLNSLHVCMAAGKAEEKGRISETIKDVNINWSRAGREEAEFLCGY